MPTHTQSYRHMSVCTHAHPPAQPLDKASTGPSFPQHSRWLPRASGTQSHVLPAGPTWQPWYKTGTPSTQEWRYPVPEGRGVAGEGHAQAALKS